MKKEELIKIWKDEESIAHIKGWDFSHLDGRFTSDEDLPWDYEALVRQYLTDDMRLFDYDTGGGEFLLSLGHPHDKTSATEGYPPNYELCKQTLLPLGIDLRFCDDCSHLPFDDESFDIVIDRHGDFNASEIARVLKTGGMFVTQQVGGENDRDLVQMVQPDLKPQFTDLDLSHALSSFESAGFEILTSDEVFRPIRFYDIGAFVWFARIIEWEFVGFSVDKCLDRLMELQSRLERDGVIEGTIHRYMFVARKK